MVDCYRQPLGAGHSGLMRGIRVENQSVVQIGCFATKCAGKQRRNTRLLIQHCDSLNARGSAALNPSYGAGR